MYPIIMKKNVPIAIKYTFYIEYQRPGHKEVSNFI